MADEFENEFDPEPAEIGKDAKKAARKGHVANADGVCGNCGLEIAYLAMANSRCAAPAEE